MGTRRRLPLAFRESCIQSAHLDRFQSVEVPYVRFRDNASGVGEDWCQSQSARPTLPMQMCTHRSTAYALGSIVHRAHQRHASIGYHSP